MMEKNWRIKHGFCMGKKPRSYTTWNTMKGRCLNPNNHKYADYGARGIRVCDRWMEFANFYADMGDAPPGMSIDRIDNNGNYEPSNCRWATGFDQANNKRNNRFLDALGKRLTISQWGREVHLSEDLIYSRLLRGWSAEKAVTTPVRQMKEQDRGPWLHHLPCTAAQLADKCGITQHQAYGRLSYAKVKGWARRTSVAPVAHRTRYWALQAVWVRA